MAIGVAVVGAMVIVWAGIAFEETLVEQWYLWNWTQQRKRNRNWRRKS